MRLAAAARSLLSVRPRMITIPPTSYTARRSMSATPAVRNELVRSTAAGSSARAIGLARRAMAAVIAISVDFISYLLSRTYLEQGACHIERFDRHHGRLFRNDSPSVMDVHMPHQ